MKPVSLLLFFTYFLSACSKISVPIPNLEEFRSTRKPVEATLTLPIKVNLGPVFQQVDSKVDYQYDGKEEQCEGVSYSYHFVRKNLQFSGKGNVLQTEVNGAYWLKANYCVRCTDWFGGNPLCISPRVYVSCGVGEPLRQVKLTLESKLSLTQNYQLQSQSRVAELKSKTPCEFSFLKYDATSLLEKELHKPLEEVCGFIDRKVSQLAIRPYVDSLWRQLQLPIAVSGLGFLHLQPQSIAIDEIQFNNQTISTNLFLSAQPEMYSVSPETKSTAVPNLSVFKGTEGFRVPVGFYLRYDSLNAQIAGRFEPIVLKQKRKELVVNKVEIIGPKNDQLLLAIDFGGRQKGRLYLLGDPVIDVAKGQFTFQNLSFSLESRNVLLKSASWVLNGPISKQLEEKLQMDISTLLAEINTEMNDAINQSTRLSNGQKLRTVGRFSHLEVHEIDYLRDVLFIELLLSGRLTAEIN